MSNNKDIQNKMLDQYKSKHMIIFNKKNIILTKRQFQCLALISIGRSSKEIAKLLNLSFRTIDTHIEAIKTKFNCKRRSDIVLIGVENSLDKYALLILKSLGKIE